MHYVLLLMLFNGSVAVNATAVDNFPSKLSCEKFGRQVAAAYLAQAPAASGAPFACVSRGAPDPSNQNTLAVVFINGGVAISNAVVDNFPTKQECNAAGRQATAKYLRQAEQYGGQAVFVCSTR